MVCEDADGSPTAQACLAEIDREFIRDPFRTAPHPSARPVNDVNVRIDRRKPMRGRCREPAMGRYAEKSGGVNLRCDFVVNTVPGRHEQARKSSGKNLEKLGPAFPQLAKHCRNIAISVQLAGLLASRRVVPVSKSVNRACREPEGANSPTKAIVCRLRYRRKKQGGSPLLGLPEQPAECRRIGNRVVVAKEKTCSFAGRGPFLDFAVEAFPPRGLPGVS
jgi:hypothetical protein